MADSKIQTRDALVAICDTLRRSGKKIVFTSGVFDLLHVGHTRYLATARSHGDVLIVGVNSDSSVRANKGPLRPIVSERERSETIAALACVDYIFLFDEKNNNKNVELLKPDRYVKAGDYNRAALSSASIVESYGGKVELAPLENGYSTSALIDRVLGRYSDIVEPGGPDPAKTAGPAVFIDRDGTLNVFVDYLSTPDQFELIPGAIQALKRLKAAGYKLIIVTNQPGIGLGYFSKENFYNVNRKFLQLLSAEGVLLDKIYFCPHGLQEGCECMKPKTGMIDRACRELPIEMKGSYMIGDTSIDMQLAKNAGIPGILLETGMGGKDKYFTAQPATTVKDISAAADYILAREKK